MPSPACPACGAALPPTGGPCAACALESALAGSPPPAPPFDPLRLPGRFGPYLVERELAAGGMGIVYAARDTRDDSEVALKLLRSALLAGAEDLARFRTEAAAAALLDHPSLARVHEAGAHGGQPFLAMERLPGPSLAERLRAGPLPSPREAAAIVAKVADAVHHAHQRGVLHRDLKPSNILFDAAGEPRLCDFGLAKLADDSRSVTLSAAQMGTPPYMSPEQAAGRTREIFTASDVWALGAILYHLLAGRPPFEGGSPAETFRRIQHTEPAPLRGSSTGRADGARVDRDLESVCLRCLEKNPARRLPSAGVVAEELRRWLAGEPVRARAITGRERALRWARRHPFHVAAGVALLGTLAAGAVTSTVLWQRAEAARERAEENAYFAGISSALVARERHDLGLARRTLAGLDPRRRGWEWHLLAWLTRGDEKRQFWIGEEPRALAWSPTRQRVAVLDAARQVRWLDPEDGAQEFGPRLPDPRARHGGQPVDFGFHALAVSPDGALLAAGDGDVLVVADARAGALLHSDVARRVQFLWLDNQRLLYGGTLGMAAESREHTSLWNRQTGKARPLPRGILAPLALTADRSRLAWVRALGGERWQIEVRDAAAPESGVPLAVLPTAESLVHLAFSPDACHLAAVEAHGEDAARLQRVLDAADGREVFHQALPRFVNAIAFHPREPLLAVATDDETVRTFRYLAPTVGGHDDGGAPELAEPVPAGGPQGPGRNLLTRSAQNGRAGFLLGHEERVGAALLTPAGLLLTGSADRTVRAWPAAPAVLAHRFSPLRTATKWEHPAASHNGRHVLALTTADQAAWWDCATGERRALPPGESPLAVLRDGAPVTRHPDTALLTVWDWSGSAWHPRWSVRTTPSHQAGFGMAVRGVLSPDERVLAALIPGRVLVVDLVARTATGTGDQRMLYGSAGVNGLALSPDARSVAATGLLGRHVRVYRAGDVNGGCVMLGEGAVFDTAAAFHPDGRRLFVGNEDGEVRVWDFAAGRELPAERWRAQGSAVSALAISNDGCTVATSGDSTLRLWDGGTPASPGARRERMRIGVAGARNWIAFADADRVLLHCAPDQALEAWEATPRR